MPVTTIPTPAVFEFHEAPTQPAGSKPRKTAGVAPLVLVVDDEADARDMYAICLEQLGYRTAQAMNGEEAVVAALRNPPDAILMDMSMPGMGGIEAMRRIKSDPRMGRCHIIMITAHGDSVFEEARAAGCDAYFCKPFNIFALDSVLRLLAPGAALPEPRNEAVVKVCGCGESYSLDAWLVLPLCGRMHAGTKTAEIRNCRCGSSLALTIDVEP